MIQVAEQSHVARNVLLSGLAVGAVVALYRLHLAEHLHVSLMSVNGDDTGVGTITGPVTEGCAPVPYEPYAKEDYWMPTDGTLNANAQAAIQEHQLHILEIKQSFGSWMSCEQLNNAKLAIIDHRAKIATLRQGVVVPFNPLEY